MGLVYYALAQPTQGPYPGGVGGGQTIAAGTGVTTSTNGSVVTVNATPGAFSGNPNQFGTDGAGNVALKSGVTTTNEVTTNITINGGTLNSIFAKNFSSISLSTSVTNSAAFTSKLNTFWIYTDSSNATGDNMLAFATANSFGSGASIGFSSSGTNALAPYIVAGGGTGTPNGYINTNPNGSTNYIYDLLACQIMNVPANAFPDVDSGYELFVQNPYQNFVFAAAGNGGNQGYFISDQIGQRMLYPLWQGFGSGMNVPADAGFIPAMIFSHATGILNVYSNLTVGGTLLMTNNATFNKQVIDTSANTSAFNAGQFVSRYLSGTGNDAGLEFAPPGSGGSGSYNQWLLQPVGYDLLISLRDGTSGNISNYIQCETRQTGNPQINFAPLVVFSNNVIVTNGTGTLAIAGNGFTNTVSGVVTASLDNSGKFSGSGAGLTSASVPDAALQSDVALLGRTPQTFTGSNIFSFGVSNSATEALNALSVGGAFKFGGATAAGYVLTDVSGNGLLTLQPPSGGGGSVSNYGPLSAFTFTISNYMVSLGGITNNSAAGFSGNGPTLTNLLDLHAAWVNVKDFGAKGDGVMLKNIHIAFNTTAVAVSNANFTSADVGKAFLIANASNTTSGTYTIVAVNNSTNVSLNIIPLKPSSNFPDFYEVGWYGTDDSGPIQKTCNYAVSNFINTVFFPGSNSIYIVTNNFQLTGSKNAQIYIPDVPNNGSNTVAPTLTFQGEQAPAPGGFQLSILNDETQPSLNGIGQYGTMIATTQLGTSGNSCLFGTIRSDNTEQFIHISIKDLGFRMPPACQMTCLDLSGASSASLEKVYIDCAYDSYEALEPSYLGSYAIKMPASGNNGPGMDTLKQTYISGFWNGLLAEEHTVSESVFINQCKNGYISDQMNHSCGAVDLRLQSCATNIYCDPTTATTFLFGFIDIEHDAAGTWHAAKADFYDPNSHLHGSVNLRIAASGGGPTNLLVTANTATNLSYFVNETNHVSGQLQVSRNIVVGATTNTPSFTLVNTNWIDGRKYTNQTGRVMYVWAPCTETPGTGIAGNATYALLVPGVTTNMQATGTLAATLAMPATNCVFAYIPAGSNFTWTNLSSGTGSSAQILNGGQYMVY